MEKKLDSVCVFMSTYNGEKYIEEQIESILNQIDVDIMIYIRDDGSTDRTIDIIKGLKAYPSQIKLYEEKNIGFEHSFAEISRKNVVADYYAFSDQDDIWKLDRLRNAISILEKESECALYGSNLYITDSDMNITRSLYSGDAIQKIKYMMEKYGIFGENMYACTMVWNRKMQQRLLEHKPIVRVSQDVWTQLVAEVIGAKVIFDQKETIYHRIHANNTAGIAKNRLQRIKKGIRIYVKSGISTKREIVKECCSFYKILNEDSEKNQIRELVKRYNESFLDRLRLLFSKCVRDKGIEGKLLTWFLVMLNKY